MNIKRYDQEYDGDYKYCTSWMQESPDGLYVRWDDIQPLLRLLEAAKVIKLRHEDECDKFEWQLCKCEVCEVLTECEKGEG